ncbi:MAG: hypothetical protein Q9178_000707 [Gyalolechia marmorata]
MAIDRQWQPTWEETHPPQRRMRGVLNPISKVEDDALPGTIPPPYPDSLSGSRQTTGGIGGIIITRFCLHWIICKAEGPTMSQMSAWAQKYRGATVEDLDPPPALSAKPTELISHALMNAFERDYTHLTVVSEDTRALLGYLNIPRLKEMLKNGTVRETDYVEQAMQKFQRSGKIYKVITMDTPLEELEAFFTGGANGNDSQDFAVVTDGNRRFVLGVATKADLEEFVKRRPA